MTLAEILEKHDATHRANFTDYAPAVAIAPPHPPALWDATDYAASTVSGGTLWMVPRNTDNANNATA